MSSTTTQSQQDKDNFYTQFDSVLKSHFIQPIVDEVSSKIINPLYLTVQQIQGTIQGVPTVVTLSDSDVKMNEIRLEFVKTFKSILHDVSMTIVTQSKGVNVSLFIERLRHLVNQYAAQQSGYENQVYLDGLYQVLIPLEARPDTFKDQIASLETEISCIERNLFSERTVKKLIEQIPRFVKIMSRFVSQVQQASVFNGTSQSMNFSITEFDDLLVPGMCLYRFHTLRNVSGLYLSRSSWYELLKTLNQSQVTLLEIRQKFHV